MKMPRPSRQPRLLPRLLLLTLAVALAAVPALAHVEDLSEGDQGEFTVLGDDTFDAHVFPKESHSQPLSWLIFFYAPWCGHCKNLLPQFANASRLLSESGLPHAKLGVVNAVKNKAVASRFAIEAYPTLIYTTGKPGLWHKFRGGYSLDNFVQFPLYLQRGVAAGSFADVLSDPRQFLEVERQLADGRVSMFVYVPATGKTSEATKAKAPGAAENATEEPPAKTTVAQRQAEARGAQWNVAVDAAASMGNVRFGVIYGDDVPDDWKEKGGSSYVAVVEAGRRCKGTGPGGEVFIAQSDAHRKPQCYGAGPWLAEPKDDTTAVQLHPSLAEFITHHGFRAVEEVTPGIFSVLQTEDHHYLGLLLTNGPLARSDVNMMPVLRELVQVRNDMAEARNEARTREAERSSKGTAGDNDNNNKAAGEKSVPQRRISLAHVDGATHMAWRKRYHIEESELPAFIVVDPRRDKVYHLRHHTPRFEEIKTQVPWLLGGEQQLIITAFLDDVEQGRAHGVKMSFIGEIAEFLLHFPGMEFLHATLGYEDAILVTVVFVAMFFSFLLFLALVVEPIMDRRRNTHTKQE